MDPGIKKMTAVAPVIENVTDMGNMTIVEHLTNLGPIVL